MDFDDFLQQVLPTAKQLPESVIEKLADNAKFEELLSVYPFDSSKLKETAPFVELANHVLKCLRLRQIQFCRDDPKIVCGSSAEHKPDVVGVLEAAITSRLASVDELNQSGPPVAFHWGELMFVEFKVDRHFEWDTPAPEYFPSEARPRVDPKPPTECKSPSDPSPRRYSTRTWATVDSTAVFDRKRKRSETHSIANKRLKLNESEKPRDNNPAQCASYALEMMSCGGFRSHVIGGLVTNSFLELVYYDHSGVIMSRAINLKKDRHRFIRFLHAFVSGGDSVWGYHPILKEPRTRNQSRRVTELQQLGRAVGIETFEGFTLKLQDGRTLTLGTTVYQAHGLIGRGTLVVCATMPPSHQGPKAVIVKLSHLPKTRRPESEIIETIQDALGRAGPRAGPRPDGRNMANHLPKVIHAEERGYGLDTPQGRLAEFFHDSNMYELRNLCILVQEELQPITSLTTADELAPAFRDIFAAYRWLYEDVRIMHRDISINNLMVRDKNGRRYGVLNDFDLAIEMNKDLLPTSKQRTGTKPFMARDLLDDRLRIEGNLPPHLYRYDLESLFYVLVFLTTHYDNGEEIESPPFGDWYDFDTLSLLRTKSAFLFKRSLPFTPAFKSLSSWVVPMWRMFRRGYFERGDHDIDSELDTRRGMELQPFCIDTLGGFVSFRTFSDILEKELK